MTFEVGDQRRSIVGRAVISSVVLGSAFFVFLLITKEVPALFRTQPWQDDPYDAAISGALCFLPLLLGLGCARLVLCRRVERLAMRRTLDLVRLCQVLLTVVMITVLTEWIGLALSAHRHDWTRTTAATAMVFALFTTGAVAEFTQLRRARRAHPEQVAFTPDWLADAISAGEMVAGRLPVGRQAIHRLVQFVDRRAIGPIRRHRIGAAATFSVGFGIAIDTPQVVIEQYSASFAIIYFTITTCSLFAFLMLSGSYFNLAGRSAVRPNAAVTAAVGACIAVPLAASFRDSIWPLLGVRNGGVADLTMLMFMAAPAGAGLGYLVGMIFKYAPVRPAV